MTTIKHVLLIALFALVASRYSAAAEMPTAKPKDVGLDADKIQQAHDAVQALIDKKEMAGAVVAVARKGKVVMFEALGESEAGSGKPMKPDAIVRIYSMTKPITTVAAMILVEEGKIGLDDPVSKYVPGVQGSPCPAGKGDETVEAKREITIRDLMRHTAGLTYGVFGNTPVDQLYKKVGVFAADDNSARHDDEARQGAAACFSRARAGTTASRPTCWAASWKSRQASRWTSSSPSASSSRST